MYNSWLFGHIGNSRLIYLLRDILFTVGLDKRL